MIICARGEEKVYLRKLFLFMEQLLIGRHEEMKMLKEYFHKKGLV